MELNMYLNGIANRYHLFDNTNIELCRFGIVSSAATNDEKKHTFTKELVPKENFPFPKIRKIVFAFLYKNAATPIYSK